MKNFRKIWDDEKNSWIKANKTMNKQDMYTAFMSRWPDSAVTFQALLNQRSRLKCSYGGCQKNPVSRRHKPLFSEHQKKGFIQIKIGEPSIWISKGRYIYQLAHPDYEYQKGDQFVFLDGDNRNFNPDNITVVSNKIMPVFNSMGGTIDGDAEATKIRIMQAKLKIAYLDLCEKKGLAKRYSKGGRVILGDANEKYKKRKANYSEEHKQELRKRAREWRKAHPLTPEQKARRKQYQHEWYLRKKERVYQ